MTRSARRGWLSVLLLCLGAQLLSPAAAAMPCNPLAASGGDAAMASSPEMASAHGDGHGITETTAHGEHAGQKDPGCCDGGELCLLQCVVSVGICSTEQALALVHESPGLPDERVDAPGSFPQHHFRPPIPA